MQGGGGKALGFGKSKARLAMNNNINFSSVAGVDEAKEELMELVEFLKNPKKFQLLGGKIPKGCLLVGNPGTGKTLLAKAVAGEANVPFFSISGSDFVEMFVGVGASRVRDMFAQAKKNAPCIIFIDEIDAVGRHRGAGLGGGNDEREQTLNQLLVEMDGFSDSNKGIIVIAATNRPDVLDRALLRPGRFDRQITVSLPDIKGREQIIAVHAKKVPMDSDVDFKVIARGTPGFSGADLANVINEAALLAARYNKTKVTMSDIEAARDKVMMGAERKSIVMKEKEIKLTAYHEAGHALVTIHSPSADPIHKATIIPRGRALGMVMSLPEDDQVSKTFEQLTSYIAIAMAGRVTEEIIFGGQNVTTGASSDIKAATNLARKMVTQWGFSKEIGYVLVGDEREEVFLGHSLGNQKIVSEALTSKVDAEIRKLIDEGYNSAKKIINQHIDQLHIIAKSLIEYETLSGAEIKDLLDGKDISSAKLTQKKQKSISEDESKNSSANKKRAKSVKKN
jgi:cell division protease FtsH